MSNPSVEIQKKPSPHLYTALSRITVIGNRRNILALIQKKKKKSWVSFKYSTELICNEHAQGMTTIKQSQMASDPRHCGQRFGEKYHKQQMES